MSSKSVLCIAALLGGFCGIGMAETTDFDAAALVFACAGCHGAGSVPDLRGMPAERFLNAMRAFQSGQRHAGIMDRIARGYNEAELAVMAVYWQNDHGARTVPGHATSRAPLPPALPQETKGEQERCCEPDEEPQP
ncbi:MAG: hypothetical protein EPN21_12360 [Methylococcaceae bacterium]|nr:MAG: hypothetical protein EPN21_12360 [Methylococcaceae bacterium]